MSDAQILNKLASNNPGTRLRFKLTPKAIDGSSPAEITIDEKDIVTYGSFAVKLDTNIYAKWDIGNFQVTFNNKFYQWREDYQYGYFPTGTQIYGSRVKCEIGTMMADGTYEYIQFFTGTIGENYQFYVDKNTIQVTIYNDFEAWQYINAENISTLVEDEQLTSGDNENYITAHNAVGIVSQVLKGETLGTAIELLPNTDYSISDLNTAGTPATIKLETPTTGTQKIYCTYRYWETDKTIEDIVALLCDAAGIDAGDRVIEKVVFANNAKTEQAGMVSGGINFGFGLSSGDTVQTSQYAITFTAGFQDYIAEWARIIKSNTASAEAEINIAMPTYGTWATYLTGGRATIKILNSSGNGYAVFNDGAGGTLYRVTGATLTSIYTSATQIYLIKRTAAGVFSLYSFDGTEYAVFHTVTDSTYLTDFVKITCSIIAAFGSVLGQLAYTQKLLADSFKKATLYDPDPLPLQFLTHEGFIYPNFNSGTLTAPGGFVKWGPLTGVISKQYDSSDYDIAFRDSDDGTTWGEWQSISLNQDVPSEKEYLQISVLVKTPYPYGIIITNLKLYAYTADTKIPVVDFTGLDADNALTQLTAICAYETGFTSDGIFFFKSREQSQDIVRTFENRDIYDFNAIESGIAQVFNTIDVEFGEYKYTSDSNSMGEASPTSIERYGARRKSISSGNFLPAANVDLAYAIAPTVYNILSTKREKVRFTCRLYPELQLSQKIKINYLRDNASPDYPAYSKYYNLKTYARIYKIVGIEWDFKDQEMTITAIEYTTAQDLPPVKYTYIALENGKPILLESGGKIKTEENT